MSSEANWAARPRIQLRKLTGLLALGLVIEIALLVSLRTLGWLGTGDAMKWVAGVLLAGLPLLVAVGMLARHRFRFRLRTLMIAVALVAVFLAVSVMPLIRFRAARRASMQLAAAGSMPNSGFVDWNQAFAKWELSSPAKTSPTVTVSVRPWLEQFTRTIEHIPQDDQVCNIGLNGDQQIRILADNYRRFPALQCVEVFGDENTGISEGRLELLRTSIPYLTHLEILLTSNIDMPQDWYRSLGNIRVLYLCSEGAFLGAPLSEKHLVDIAMLPKLEILFVVGYALDDAGAQTLAMSPSLKRIHLRHTAVTAAGEAALADPSKDRTVFRN